MYQTLRLNLMHSLIITILKRVACASWVLSHILDWRYLFIYFLVLFQNMSQGSTLRCSENVSSSSLIFLLDLHWSFYTSEVTKDIWYFVVNIQQHIILTFIWALNKVLMCTCVVYFILLCCCVAEKRQKELIKDFLVQSLVLLSHSQKVLGCVLRLGNFLHALSLFCVCVGLFSIRG